MKSSDWGAISMSRLQEFHELFHQIQLAWEKNEQTVLVILADAKGSAYRLPGTKMLMTSGGTMVGTISGGCLESDLFEWAQKVFTSNQIMTLQYDLSENEIWSLGIGCKGNLEFIFLPILPQNLLFKKINEILSLNLPFTFIIDMIDGDVAIIDKENNHVSCNTNIPLKVIDYANNVYSKQTRAEIMAHENKRYYIDIVKPSENLIVVGAGKDAIPVVNLAVKVGFSVTVLDRRTHFNNEQYFPKTTHITSDIENLVKEDFLDSWWIIMNHHQEKDQASLKLAIESSPRYIGVLGPAYRTNEMLENIGYTINSAPIHSPVGLDIGAESSDEVAISLVSEIMSLRAGRSQNHLHGIEKIHV